jgi:hypothetical protein
MIALALITVFSAAVSAGTTASTTDYDSDPATTRRPAESGGPVAEPAHLRKGGAGRRLV